uniref:C-type lectin domain-containing protein n=1 Tax=Paramormyrops kingsleyae TaxID=1676925 RepID=A0A3B3SS20_9TELE
TLHLTVSEFVQTRVAWDTRTKRIPLYHITESFSVLHFFSTGTKNNFTLSCTLCQKYDLPSFKSVIYYHFVNINLTWTDAQAYCRENYTDLATIDNMEEMKRLTGSVGSDYTGEAWIGLKKGTSWRWQWSSGEGDTGYINWDNGEPKNNNNNKHCTKMLDRSTWDDHSCSSETGHFICYTGE